MTEGSEADPTADGLLAVRDWPLSNVPIAVAILLLVATAIGLVVSTERVANRLATGAYYALAIGTLLRVVEHTVGRRVRIEAMTRRVVVWVRVVRAALVEWLVVPRPLLHAADRMRAIGVDGLVSGRVRRLSRTEADDADARSVFDEEVREGVALAIPLTVVGGLMLVAWWSVAPRRAVSSAFLLGWLCTLVVLVGVWILLVAIDR